MLLINNNLLGQNYYLKSFDMNNNGVYGEVSRSSVLSRDEKYLIVTDIHSTIIGSSDRAVMQIERYDISNKTMQTIDSISMPNKGIYGALGWNGSLVCISDTSYVLAYQIADTTKDKNKFKSLIGIYCFTLNGDSLWNFTYLGSDSLAYLGGIYNNKNQLFVTGLSFYKIGSFQSYGIILSLDFKGNIIFDKKTEQIPGGANGFNYMYIDTSIYVNFFSFEISDPTRDEGMIYKINSSGDILDSVVLLKASFNNNLNKLISVDIHFYTYLGNWDTSNPYDPKIKQSKNTVFYISKVDKQGKLIKRSFLADGVNYDFFNKAYAQKQKNGNIIICINERSELEKDMLGWVNIGVYCMDTNGNILWKRRYYSHKGIKYDTYSSDMVLKSNDDILITGWGNNVYDTTDLEWDIIVLSLDKDGCMDPANCKNYYPTSAIEEVPVKSIPFVLYPNPAQTYCMVLLSEPSIENTTITLYNPQGKITHQQIFEAGLWDLKLSFPTLTKGNYMVEVKNKKEVVGVRKLVVE